MDVFDLADNLRAEFQEKGVSNEEFLLKIAETYDIKRLISAFDTILNPDTYFNYRNVRYQAGLCQFSGGRAL